MSDIQMKKLFFVKKWTLKFEFMFMGYNTKVLFNPVTPQG